MKTISLTALLLASALSLAGCNKGAAPAANNSVASKPEATNTPAPAPAPAANATNEADEEEGGGAPSAQVGTARQNFSVVNATGHTVVTLNVSPASQENWGEDVLGTQVIANGQTAQIVFDRGETQCIYDIRATYDDGDTTDERGVNLCQTATVRLTAE